jgi:hypothetical protein
MDAVKEDDHNRFKTPTVLNETHPSQDSRQSHKNKNCHIGNLGIVPIEERPQNPQKIKSQLKTMQGVI